MTGDARWDDNTEAKMLAYFGEVLPYVDLDEKTLAYDYTYGTSYDEDYEYFYIYDQSGYNSLENYGAKLESFGYKHSKYGNTYRRDTESGDRIWVSYGYANGVNVIQVEMPIYYEVQYFIAQGYTKVGNDIEDHLLKIFEDEDLVDEISFIFDGLDWYEHFDLYTEEDRAVEYYRDLLAVKGLYGDALGVVLEDLGFTYNSRSGAYINDDDVWAIVQSQDDVTVLNLLGIEKETATFTEAYFLAEGFDVADAFPQEDVDAVVPEANRFTLTNGDKPWYVQLEEADITMYNQHLKQLEVVTEGDLSVQAYSALKDAGYTPEGETSQGEAYAIDEDHYLYVDVLRGYTFFRIYEWSPIPPFGPAEVAKEVKDFYADYYGLDVEISFEGFADDATFKTSDAYVSSYGEYDVRIYFEDSDPFDEEDLFVERLEEAGWEATYVGGFYDYTVTNPATGALLSMYAWNNYILIECTAEESGQGGGEEEALTIAAAFDSAEEYLAESYGFEVDFPAYPASDDDVEAEAGLAINWSSFTLYYEVTLYGTTNAEKEAFVAALVEAGWTVEESTVYPGDYYCTYGNYGVVPMMTIEVYSSYVIFGFDAGLSAIDSFDLVAAGMEDYYAGYGLAADIPTFDVADEDAYFEVVTEDYTDDGSLIAYVNYVTEDEVEAYADKLAAAGWTVEEDHGVYYACRGSIGVVPYLVMNTAAIDNGYIQIECYPGYAVVEDADLVAFYATLFFYQEGLNVNVPAFEFSSSNQFIFVNDMYLDRGYLFADIRNANVGDAAAYAAALTAAGWTVAFDEADVSFVAFSNKDNGPTAVCEGAFDPESNVLELVYYTTYNIVDVTPETVAGKIGNMLGFNFTASDDGSYFLSLMAPAAALSMDEIKDMCVEIADDFAAYGFAPLADDWASDTLSDDTPCEFLQCYNADAGILIQFLVWVEGATNHFQITVSEVL